MLGCLPLIQAQDCSIISITATPNSCDGYYFSVSVNMEVDNPSSSEFTLAGNGIIYGTYFYSQLPVNIGPLLGDNDSQYELIAWDVENPACQNFTSFEAINCGPICHFYNAQMDLISCNSLTHAAIELDFDTSGVTSNVFDLYDEDGNEISSHLYASLPVQILTFETNGADSIKLMVCDHNTDCCELLTFPPIDCNPNNCEFYNVSIDPTCLVNNFVVTIDFEHENHPSDSFTVRGNGINYGKFAYTELPITLGPLNGNSNIEWEFVIRDSDLESCSEVILLGQYHCPPNCDVLEFMVDPLLCISDDGYSLLLEMQIEGHGQNGFSVFTENAYYGSHAYEDLPLTLPFIAGSGNFVDYITVCDNDFHGCCQTVGYEALLCAGCLLYNLEVDLLPCNEQEEFFAEIDFDYTNTGQDGFNVSGNGTDYGNFDYEDLPILIGPFDGSEEQFIEFVVTDNENSLCFAAIEVGALACNDICNLFDLQATAGVCTGNSQYVLELSFGFENSLADEFDLYANGEFYASYHYSDLPLTIVDFEGSGSGQDLIRVVDSEDLTCFDEITIEAPPCECSIFDLTAQQLPCTSDTTFGLEIEFFYENLPGDFVDVFFDGVLIGFYNVNELPFVINSIPEGSGTGLLQVCANDLSTCCVEIPIELDTCGGPACQLTDLFAEPGNCNSDSSFILDITFDTMFVATDSVRIYANDSLIGKFFITPNFIRIINFPELPGDLTTLTVCSVVSDDCCDTYVFETPHCGPQDCSITDLVVVPGECNTEETYEVVIEYNAENVNDDAVTVTVNFVLLDTFVAPNNRIEILNFPVVPTEFTRVEVCSVSNPDCCDVYEFETKDCEKQNECAIDIGTVDIGECFEDSTYVLHVNFIYFNLPEDSVIIYAGDESLGTFFVNEGEITIEHFPWNNNNHSVIRICAAGAKDCCSTLEFETPDCGGSGECDVDDLQAIIGDCLSDSTYILTLNFNFSNLPTDSVVVDANGEVIGTFHVNEGHVVIEHFPVFETNLTELHVCAQENDDCCEVVVFETPDCTNGGTCNLFDLFAERGECTSENTFLVDIVFHLNNFDGDSVEISANDISLGNFLITPNFIRIENFPLLPGETVLITVCAEDGCCDTYTLENPSCTEECDIFGVAVDLLECTSDTTFGVVVNFNWEHIDAGGFDLYAGDDYLGFYPKEQVPVTINDFPANLEGEYVITICESDNTECCETFEFEGPVCVDICNIWDLTYTTTEPDTDGMFFFILDFNFEDQGTAGFNVVGNGNQYGNFSYENLPIEIGPFECGTTTVFEFLVSDAQNPACFDFVEPGLIDCTVANEEVSSDEIFGIFNNGALPGIFAKQDLTFSLYNSNGKRLIEEYSLSANQYFEMPKFSEGFYLAMITHEGTTWPVKLVKSGH